MASDLKQRKFDFIYLRAAFLDPLPIILRMRGQRCFIESNGIQFEGIKVFYRSHLAPLNRLFEKVMYSSAAHVFFVGSYGDYWRLQSSGWSNVENGVDEDFLDHFPTPRMPHAGTLRFCFVGSLMPHHRPDILIGAMRRLTESCRLELHLVGEKLDAIAESLQEYMPVTSHGFLTRSDLAAILKCMDVGVIPGVPDYQSQMKLFDYGAARMAVVAPNTHHLTTWFPESLVFFNAGDTASMASAIMSLANDRQRIADLGNRLHERISREFTWKKIFARKAEIIKQQLHEMR